MTKRWKKIITRLRAKLEIIENLIFLDIPIAATAIVLFTLISLCPVHLVPDYLGLSSVDKNEYLSLVIGSVSSILGIVVSVILIRFELVKQRLGRQVNNYFLRNAWFKRLVTLLTVTICWALLVFLASIRFDANSLTTHLYLVAYLFFASIMLLFPSSYNILISSTSLQIIRHELEKLDDSVISSFTHKKNIYFRESYPLFDIDENTPIDILKRLAQTFIRENDTNAAKLLLFFSCDHLISWIGISNDRNIVNANPNMPMHRQIAGVSNDQNIIGTKIDIITSIWHVIAIESIAQKNIELLCSLWNTFFQLHEHYAKNKMYLLYLENLDSFERKYVDLLQQNNMSAVLALGVKYRGNVMILHLTENCPEEKYLEDLGMYSGEPYVHVENHNTAENIEWDHISEFWTITDDRTITDNIRYAIDVNDKHLLSVAFRTMRNLINDIVRLENLGEKQKGFIVIRLYESCAYYFLKVVKSDNYNEDILLPRIFDGSYSGNYVETDTIYYKRVISAFSDFVINLCMLKFDYSALNYINNLATLGRYCREKVNKEKRFLNTCYLVVDTFKYLQPKFEADIAKYGKGYIELKRQIESVRDWGKSHDKEADKKLIEYCNSIVATFKPEHLVEQPESKFVNWHA